MSYMSGRLQFWHRDMCHSLLSQFSRNLHINVGVGKEAYYTLYVFSRCLQFFNFLIYQIMSRTPNKFSGFTFSMLLVTPQSLALA